MQTVIPIGDLVDNRFRILAQLGEGGFGSVYLAQQIDMERKVALKFIHANSADNDELIARFEREARIIAGLNHKNIVHCYSYGIWRNRIPYLALEYLEGQTLHQLIAESKTIPWQQAFQYGIEICAALTELHDQSIVHRDLKPENIMITRDGTLKLIDFGLVSIDGQKLTKTGAVVGSLLYISPEQAYGEKATPASDVYALGCVVYEMLTGHAPFTGTVPGEILTLHATAEPVPPTKLVSGLPPRIDRIILRALQKNPFRRYESAAEFSGDLQACILNETINTPEITSTGTIRGRNIDRTGRAGVAALVITVASAGIGLFMFNEKNNKDAAIARLEVQIENELQRSGLLNPVSDHRAYVVTGTEALLSSSKIAGSSRQNTKQTNEIVRESVAHFRNARALAANQGISNDLRGKLLLVQAHTWFGGSVTFDETMKWLEEARAVLQNPLTQPSVRKELQSVTENLQIDAQQAIFSTSNNILYEPFQTASPPGPHAIKTTIRELQLPVVSKLSPQRDLPSQRHARVLRNYAIVLASEGHAKEACTKLEEFINSDKISDPNRIILVDGLALSALGDGDLSKSLHALRHIQRLTLRTPPPYLIGIEGVLLLYAKAGGTRQEKIAEDALDVGLQLCQDERTKTTLRVRRFELYATSMRNKAKAMPLLPGLIKGQVFVPKKNDHFDSDDSIRIARGLYHLGEIESAASYCLQALPSCKGFAREGTMLEILANCYLDSEQTTKAKAVLKHGLELTQPEIDKWWFAIKLSGVLIQQKEFHALEQLLRTMVPLIDFSPKRERWFRYRWVAETYATIPGGADEALLYAKKSLDAAGGNADYERQARNELCSYYVLADQPAEALKQFDRCQPQGKPLSDFDRQIWLSNSLSTWKRYEKAIAAREQAIFLARTKEQKYRANYRQALDFIALKKYELAQPFVTTMAQLVADDGKTTFLNSIVLFNVGQKENSRLWFRRYLANPIALSDWMEYLKKEQPTMYRYLLETNEISKDIATNHSHIQYSGPR